MYLILIFFSFILSNNSNCNIENSNTEEGASSTDEDDQEVLNVSLDAMEEKLIPKVLKVLLPCIVDTNTLTVSIDKS